MLLFNSAWHKKGTQAFLQMNTFICTNFYKSLPLFPFHYDLSIFHHMGIVLE